MKNALLGLALALAAVPAAAWERLDGQHSAIRSFHAEAVSDEAAWKALWARHAPGRPVPEADFSREQVAAVFLGETMTGGVKVDVTVAPDPLDASRLVVFYKPVKSPRGFAVTAVCHPFAIVKTRKASAVSFEPDVSFAVPAAREELPANPVDLRRAGMLLQTLTAPSFDGR